jgi:hypothetical protein
MSVPPLSAFRRRGSFASNGRSYFALKIAEAHPQHKKPFRRAESPIGS